MILIIGGSFQGKEEFAEAMFSQGESLGGRMGVMLPLKRCLRGSLSVTSTYSWSGP